MFKYDRNSNVFEKIDTEEKAYWLGFLYADGYINEEHNFITLGLAEKDKEHIEKFQSFLETDLPYQDRLNNGGYPCRFFRISDKKLVKDLVNQGCKQNKSLTSKPDFEMNDKFLIHWTRGLFDGDGSIYPNKENKIVRYRINLCGTKEILLKVQEIWDIDRKLDFNRSIPKFVLCKKDEVNRILRLMYDEATIYLNRKYELAYKAIKQNLQ